MDAEVTTSAKMHDAQGARPLIGHILQAPQEDQAMSHRTLLHVTEHGGGATAGEAHRHILVPVDDTSDSEAALQWVIDNGYRQGDIIHLLNVIPEPQMIHVWAGMYVPPDDDAELEEIEDTKVFVRHRFATTLLQAGIPFQLHIIVGTVDSSAVASVIVKKAEELGACCITMARHSKGKLKELFMGSVTAEVTKKASVPVIVVPHGA